jgi:hypothetical protein
MIDADTGFLFLLVLILSAMGVSSFIESMNPSKAQKGEMMFALLYLVGAVGLIIFKISSP